MIKKSRFFLLQRLKLLAVVPIYFLGVLAGAQTSLSDCTGAIEVCGNGAISSNATGFGQQEISSNACFSEEHHSLWIRIEITKSGTLGFTLTPTNPQITIDYDFFVFGPDATCGNLGDAIRCSTTNPQAAGQPDNLTGMNDEETETSEGPGASGNSFVKSLDVQPGETYYIVIDRPIGQSPFDLEWTGTSTVGEFPFPEGVEANAPEDLVQCGINGAAEFDILETREEINDQPQTEITYFANLEDAVDQTNELQGTYTSNSPLKTIYARVENLLTGCSEIVDFDLIVSAGPPIPENIDYELCDLDNDGLGIFDLLSRQDEIFEGIDPNDHSISFHADLEDAQNGTPQVASAINTGGGRFYARVEENSGMGCYSISEINLQLNAPESLSGIASEEIGLKVTSRTISVGLSGNFDFSLNDPNGPYSEDAVLKNVPPGMNTLYIRKKDQCEIISKEVLVPEYSSIISPNNDGTFDTWSVNTGNFPVEDEPVTIFDRYGRSLAEIRVNSGSWDGTYNGKELPADDYWFMFSLPDGNLIKGHFSLVR